MTIAQGSQLQLSYIAEDIYGTTPTDATGTASAASGLTTLMPVTGCGIQLSKNTLTSNTITSHRQRTFVRHGMQMVGGPIPFEFIASESAGNTFLDDWLAAVLMSTWETDTLKVGSTFKSFSVEKDFTDINVQHLFSGIFPGGMSLSVQPDAIVTGSFDTMGKALSTSTAFADDSPQALPATEPIDSFSGTINEGGSSISIVTGLDLNLTNNAERANVLGSDSTYAIHTGKCIITGTLNAWFEDQTLLDKFVNGTSSSLEFTLTDGSNTYTFTLPQIKYTGGEAPYNETGITLNMPFEAEYSSSDATALQIVRSLA